MDEPPEHPSPNPLPAGSLLTSAIPPAVAPPSSTVLIIDDTPRSGGRRLHRFHVSSTGSDHSGSSADTQASDDAAGVGSPTLGGTVANGGITDPSVLPTGTKATAVAFQTRSNNITDVLVTKKAAQSPNDAVDEEIQTDAATNVHTMPLPMLAKQFSTSLDTGLRATDAAVRLASSGPNVLKIKQPNPLWKLFNFFFGQFGPLIWGAAILCFIAWKPVGDPPDPVNLGLAIVLCVVGLMQGGFTAVQEFSSGRVMKTLAKMSASSATVLRDGVEAVVPAAHVVPGDVLVFKGGEKLAADIRFTELHSVQLNLANLTGESEPVLASLKATSDNYMQSRNLGFSGCGIVEGSGRGVVIATGNNTVLGKVALLANTTTLKTPLMSEIHRLVIILTCWAIGTAAFVAILWGAWLRNSYPDFMTVAGLLTTMVGVAVTFIPEGLPFAVGLTLTSAAKRMYKNKILMRNLGSVETLGSVDVICSDKTGTLTQNKMTVGAIVYSNGVEREKVRLFRLQSTQQRAFLELLLGLSLCNNATYTTTERAAAANAFDETFSHKVTGDASDSAILHFCLQFVKVQQVRERSSLVNQIPFNSRNKWMLSIHNVEEGAAIALAQEDSAEQLETTSPSTVTASSRPSQRVLYMKGAAELVLKRCTRMLSASGSHEENASGERWVRMSNVVTELADKGYRMLAVARTTLDPSLDVNGDLDADILPLDNLCFVGMVGLVDPPRPEVPGCIKKFHTAGVKVVMVTGDHPGTATAIARSIGIIRSQVVHVVQDFNSAWKSESILPLSAVSHDDNDDKESDDAHDDESRAIVHPQSYETRNSASVQSGFFNAFAHDSRDGKAHETTPQALALKYPASALAAIAVRGEEIASLTPEQWDYIFAHRDIVFARTTPDQKLRIVKECQARGHCVAVTGDGVNDAPALKKADIGVCMGSGSDVAKEAAAVVLLDDNFSSLVVAIEHGRLLFENLKKVMLYLIPAGEWAEVLPVLVNVLLGVPQSLSSFLMIYICCATDIAPALSLVKERAEADVMRKPPRDRQKEPLVNFRFILDAFFYKGTYLSFFAFVMYFWYMKRYGGFDASDLLLAFNQWGDGYKGYTQDQINEFFYTGQSVYFITLVISQFGNLLTTRTRYLSIFQQNPLSGPTRNLALFRSMFISITLALLVVYIPFIQNILNTRPPPFEFWLMPFVFALGLILIDEIRKWYVRAHPQSLLAKLAW